MMKRVLITGDSHTAMLYKGLQSICDDSNCEIKIRPMGSGEYLRSPFYEEDGDAIRITHPTYRKRLGRIPPSDDFDFLGLSMPFHSARVFRHPDWQRYAPWKLATGEIPLSQGVLEQTILADQHYILSFVANLVRRGYRVFAIEAPRPFRHHPALKLTRPEVILFIDGLFRRLVSEELLTLGTKIVKLPDEAIDEQGFMKDEFRNEQARDTHHGNAVLGGMIMEKVRKLCHTWDQIDGVL